MTATCLAAPALARYRHCGSTVAAPIASTLVANAERARRLIALLRRLPRKIILGDTGMLRVSQRRACTLDAAVGVMPFVGRCGIR